MLCNGNGATSHLESFMLERKFEKKFFKKGHISTPNGVLLIFKLPFSNGSDRNGVCRALWALCVQKHMISFSQNRIFQTEKNEIADYSSYKYRQINVCSVLHILLYMAVCKQTVANHI